MADTREKLSPITIALHWVIGLTMIGMVIFGMILADLPKSSLDKAALLGLHKSIGVLVIVLVAWRLWRRLRMGLPEHVGPYASWEQGLARAIHYFLMFATLALPLSGILFTLFAGRPVQVFGMTLIPQILTEKNQPMVALFHGMHDIMGKLLLAAVAVHIAGALKHHVLDRDATLRRMLGARVAAQPRA